jgi:hypothetical protein
VGGGVTRSDTKETVSNPANLPRSVTHATCDNPTGLEVGMSLQRRAFRDELREFLEIVRESAVERCMKEVRSVAPDLGEKAPHLEGLFDDEFRQFSNRVASRIGAMEHDPDEFPPFMDLPIATRCGVDGSPIENGQVKWVMLNTAQVASVVMASHLDAEDTDENTIITMTNGDRFRVDEEIGMRLSQRLSYYGDIERMSENADWDQDPVARPYPSLELRHQRAERIGCEQYIIDACEAFHPIEVLKGLAKWFEQEGQSLPCNECGNEPNAEKYDLDLRAISGTLNELATKAQDVGVEI